MAFSLPKFGKAPAPAKAVSNGLPVWWNEKVGVTEPAGFFDPLKLSEGQDAATLTKFREAELKHGRVAMLATLGFVVSEAYHPMMLSTTNVDAVYAFQAFERLNDGPLVVLLILVAAAEGAVATKRFEELDLKDKTGYMRTKKNAFKMRTDIVPGDLNFDPLNLFPTDPEEQLERQNQELNHGRLAMLSIAGFVAQEKITNEGIFEGWFTGDVTPFSALHLPF
mgnify:FL=1